MQHTVITARDLEPATWRDRHVALSAAAILVALVIGVAAGHWLLPSSASGAPEAQIEAARADVARLQREVDAERRSAERARGQIAAARRAGRREGRAEERARARAAAAARAARVPAPAQRAPVAPAQAPPAGGGPQAGGPPETGGGRPSGGGPSGGPPSGGRQNSETLGMGAE